MGNAQPGDGDQFTVGNIINSIGVAIGRGAQATVNVFRDREALRAQRDRRAMLDLVEDFWVEGVLERSLYGASLIELDLEERPDAVDSQPWDEVLQTPNGASPSSLSGTTIVDIFHEMSEMNRTLLILGEPGSGKTTMLLDLARHTIKDAQDDPSLRIPVVFNLSSWAIKRQRIADWLVDELNDKYFVPENIGRPWIENDDLLLLLDGLDEVQDEYQTECVTAINSFQQEHRMPIVVCSRVDEYDALTVRLKFQRAILLQPLTMQQINSYLQEAGDEFAPLGETLQRDSSLQQLAQTPLMLNTMVRAFHGLSLPQLQSLDSTAARRRYVFDAYVQRMFRHGVPKQPFPPERTIHWLTWLARQMSRHSQAVFLIERLQPDWLSARSKRWAYVLMSRLAVSLIGGLIGGIMIGLGFALFFGEMAEGLTRGFVEGFVSCLIAGLVVGLIDTLRIQQSGKTIAVLRSLGRWQLPIHIAVLTIIVGASVRLGFGLIFGLSNWLGAGPDFWLAEGRDVGLIVGLCFGLLFGFGTRGGRQILTDDIRAVEFLSWSQLGAVTGGLYGLIAGLASGVILWLSDFMPSPLMLLFSEWRVLLTTVPILTLIGIILGGFTGSIVQTPNKPNQGIWLSIRNAAVIGTSIGVMFALIGALIGALSSGLDAGLTFGMYGLFFGVPAALWYGGLDVIKHGALRLILLLDGHMPPHYARFLNYAADRMFLRKVGVGFIFIHPLLRDYFAELGAERW